jgi:hypothetical protein
MQEQLPQNGSHFVSSSLGLIGHHNHAERLVCLERRHFEIIVLAVRHTATKDANVSPSQGGLNTVHQLRLQEARENLVDWSSHLEFEVEVEAFRGAALTCEHGGPIKCGPYRHDSHHADTRFPSQLHIFVCRTSPA